MALPGAHKTTANGTGDIQAMNSTTVQNQAPAAARPKTSETQFSDYKRESDHGQSEGIETINQAAEAGSAPTRKRYTILSEKEKIFTIMTVSTINMLVWFSGTMFYPALEPIAKALHVSTAKIYLSITASMLAQGIAPLFTGYLSDIKGRRPVLFVCLLISLATNIGLACQTNYAVLLILRCLHGVWTIGATVVTFATVVDIVARAERGKYMAYTTMGSTIGSSLGPVLGGVLTQYLGWRSIFWFLAIFSGVTILLLVLFLRETCRVVVGNGSIPPQPWNKTLICWRESTPPDYETRTTFTRRPRVFDTIRLMGDRQIGLLIFFWCLVSWGQTLVPISIPVLMTKKYHLDSLKVGLCYIPWAVGGITARWTVGSLSDWNFRRLAHQAGVEVQCNQQTKEDLQKIPLEKVRLQIAFPALYLCCLFALGYSWTVAYNSALAGPLVMMFFLGNAIVGATNVLSALIMDVQAYQPGMTRAAMALFRCIPNAGVVAIINPAIRGIGFGWLVTIFVVSWLVGSSVLWVIYFQGEKWRTQREKKNSGSDG